MDALGQGIKSLGSGIAKGIESFTGDQDEMALAKAKSGYLTDRAKLDEGRDNTTDPTELGTYDQKHQEIIQKWGGTLRGRNAEKWNIEFAPKAAEYGVKVRDKVFNIEKNKAFAETNDMIDLMRELIIDPQVDDDRRQLAIETANDMLVELKNKGYIDDLEYQKRSKQWVENYTVDRFKMLPPDERAYAAGGIEGALVGRESGGRPWIVNGFGFAGLYQFGAPRLQTLGIYEPGSNEDMGGWNKSSKGAPGKWSGTFNIPGFPQVKTLQDFLNSPEAQRKAWEVHSAYMDKEISSRNLDQYIGQTIGGVLITRDGIKAMMHLGGAGGAKRVLDSGGAQNPQDANGTSLLNYAKMASRSDGGMINILPPDKREALKQQAYKELADIKSTAEQNTKVEQSRVQTLIGEDTASIAATGQPIADLTTGRVRMSLGDEAAQIFERNREHAQRFHGTTKNFDGMSPADMAEALKGMDPRVNGEAGKPGFKDAMDWYEKAEKKRDAVVAERTRDPASVADRQPETKDAKGSADLNDPKTYGPLVARRIAAQARLGIVGAQQRYFTEAEATALMEPFDNAIDPKGEQMALKQLVSTLQEVFEDDREKIEKAVSDLISNYNVSVAEREVLARVLTKLGKGEQVTQSDKQDVTQSGAAGAQEKAANSILGSIVQGMGATGVGVTAGQNGAQFVGSEIAKMGRMSANQTEQLWDAIGTKDEAAARQAFTERFGKEAVEAALKARPQTWNPAANKKFAKGPPKIKGEHPPGSGQNQYDELQKMRDGTRYTTGGQF